MNNKVTITIAGGAGNGLPSFAMLLARAAANAGMKVNLDHKTLDEIDENGVRKLGPEALQERLVGLAEAGVELDIFFKQTPRGVTKGAAEQHDPQTLPPPGAGFVKEDHPMAPQDTPFAEVAPGAPMDEAIALAKGDKDIPIVVGEASGVILQGFRLMLPVTRNGHGDKTHVDGRSEIPPNVVTRSERPTPEDALREATGLLTLDEATAGAFCWIARFARRYSPRPYIQPVRVETRYVVVEDGQPLEPLTHPFEK